MNRGDASFTFLHRVNEVELNIEDGRWQSALALALTLPDICGGIAYPDLVKKYKNGRIMLDRQKNPSRDVGGQYIRWFDEYAGKFFKISPEDRLPYISGERCWQLRCEYLHQNKGFLNDENEDTTRFHLGVNCGTSLCQLDKNNKTEGGNDIRIDIEQFCRRMCKAAKSYYHDVYKEKNFSLYNTPVLDFIQSAQRKKLDFLIVILCNHKTYGNGLYLALQSLPVHIFTFTSFEEMRKRIGRQKPNLWIIEEAFLNNQENEKNQDFTAPVLLLTGPITKKESAFTRISMPVLPETLRLQVLNYLPVKKEESL